MGANELAKFSPQVAIVIPVYNKEVFVAQAVRSVRNQSYRNLDILVVDDGSTDRSRKVIEGCIEGDPRIRFYSQDNQGVASARNRGLTDSEGEFIIFLDGDDYLYPTYVEKAVRYMTVHLEVDLLHVGWDVVDELGRWRFRQTLAQQEDYLRTLVLGNLFAPHGVFCRRAFLSRIGLFKFFTVTDDWEYWIRCAREGGRFQAMEEVLVAYRVHPQNNKRVVWKQKKRFFPIIEEVFDPSYGLPLGYRRLETLSRIRHHFFLMIDYRRWGWLGEARRQFGHALELLRRHPYSWREYSYVLKHVTVSELVEVGRLQPRPCSRKGLLGMWAWAIGTREPVKKVALRVLEAMKPIAGWVRRAPQWLESQVQRVEAKVPRAIWKEQVFDHRTGIEEVKGLTMSYLDCLRVVHGGELAGYRYSKSTRQPVLYGTLASLLTKHLYGVRDRWVGQELELIRSFQGEDGLFRDPVIACREAEGMYHGWGWRHLTLHALMTLSLYEVPLRKEIPLLEPYDHPDRFRKFLESRDWSGQAAWTGNEIQNIGVLLQYVRDYQGSTQAGLLIDLLYDVVDSHQNQATGLYGDTFQTPEHISSGVMSAYHLWLLYFYDGRPMIPRMRRVVDLVLSTQNVLGGFGVKWNSSACEDMDSIDPLARFSRSTERRRGDIEASLRRALPALLNNFNGDGGWVYRRHQANQMVHSEMFSAANEADLFYTWYRTLSLAYVLTALDEIPSQWNYAWQFKRAPGHQFPLDLKTDAVLTHS